MKTLKELSWCQGVLFMAGEFVKRSNTEIGEDLILTETVVKDDKIEKFPIVGRVMSIWFSGMIQVMIKDEKIVELIPNKDFGYDLKDPIEEPELTPTEKKIQDKVNYEAKYVEQEGYSSFSVCDDSRWDRDYWAHKDEIMAALSKRGYHVTSKTNHGVLDILAVRTINVN